MSGVIVSLSKDPDEDLDYTWDFARLLATGESIVSYSFPATPAALTLHDDAAGSAAVTAWLSGGTDGQTYDVPCRVVTDSSPPRTFERTIRLTTCQK